VLDEFGHGPRRRALLIGGGLPAGATANETTTAWNAGRACCAGRAAALQLPPHRRRTGQGPGRLTNWYANYEAATTRPAAGRRTGSSAITTKPRNLPAGSGAGGRAPSLPCCCSPCAAHAHALLRRRTRHDRRADPARRRCRTRSSAGVPGHGLGRDPASARRCPGAGGSPAAGFTTGRPLAAAWGDDAPETRGSTGSWSNHIPCWSFTAGLLRVAPEAQAALCTKAAGCRLGVQGQRACCMARGRTARQAHGRGAELRGATSASIDIGAPIAYPEARLRVWMFDRARPRRRGFRRCDHVGGQRKGLILGPAAIAAGKMWDVAAKGLSDRSEGRIGKRRGIVLPVTGSIGRDLRRGPPDSIIRWTRGGPGRVRDGPPAVPATSFQRFARPPCRLRGVPRRGPIAIALPCEARHLLAREPPLRKRAVPCARRGAEGTFSLRLFARTWPMTCPSRYQRA